MNYAMSVRQKKKVEIVINEDKMKLIGIDC